jgi:hypothetical protein
MDLQNSYQINLKNLIKNFHIRNTIHLILQAIIMSIFGYYYFTKDWATEIEVTIKSIFSPDDKANKEVIPVTIGCLKLGCKLSLLISAGIMIWRVVYNMKYLKFFDGNVEWFNNYTFYITYSLVTPILCTMIEDKNYQFYQYFIYAEIYSAYIMAFAFVLVLGIFFFYCLIGSIGGTREVGRGYEGNTQVTYYEYTDSIDFGCGGSKIRKIVNCSYKLLTVLGCFIPILIVVFLNCYLTKIFVLVELMFNIYIRYYIHKIKQFLKKQNNSINDNRLI